MIRQKAFYENSELEWLHLANNNISMIAGDAFSGLNQLRFLNLEGNQIKAIGARVLAHLSRYKIIRVYEPSTACATYIFNVN